MSYSTGLLLPTPCVVSSPAVVGFPRQLRRPPHGSRAQLIVDQRARVSAIVDDPRGETSARAKGT